MLERPGLVLVVTIRRDGSPRLSPVEPFFWDGELWLALMWKSQKAADLRRDSRILVHSIVSNPREPEGEAKVRGRAILEEDPKRRATVCRAIGAALPWEPDPDWVEMFRVDVESVSRIHYSGDGDQHVMLWPVRSRFVRRALSATSVGEPEEKSTF